MLSMVSLDRDKSGLQTRVGPVLRSVPRWLRRLLELFLSQCRTDRSGDSRADDVGLVVGTDRQPRPGPVGAASSAYTARCAAAAVALIGVAVAARLGGRSVFCPLRAASCGEHQAAVGNPASADRPAELQPEHPVHHLPVGALVQPRARCRRRWTPRSGRGSPRRASRSVRRVRRRPARSSANSTAIAYTESARSPC